uniref:Homologous recombination OB-fold protein OB-fold domain-containing protein n=1 Tax=Tanacetum cinerariifolium TaxID=118510 RepID=A0A699GLH9_TANCI|nr:hypothetical protein [Tanacetum cinerariifolium]
MRSSSITRVEPSLLTSNPVRIILGHVGIVQQAKMLKEKVFILDSDGALMSTQEYMQKVVEDVGEDDDFKSGVWRKLDEVVAIVKSCSPNDIGNLNVTMKYLLGTIPKTIHHKVIGDDGNGKDITVRAAMILANVSVFTPKPSKHYLNITMRNMVKVFYKHQDIVSQSLLVHHTICKWFQYCGNKPSVHLEKGISIDERNHVVNEDMEVSKGDGIFVDTKLKEELVKRKEEAVKRNDEPLKQSTKCIRRNEEPIHINVTKEHKLAIFGMHNELYGVVIRMFLDIYDWFCLCIMSYVVNFLLQAYTLLCADMRSRNKNTVKRAYSVVLSVCVVRERGGLADPKGISYGSSSGSLYQVNLSETLHKEGRHRNKPSVHLEKGISIDERNQFYKSILFAWNYQDYGRAIGEDLLAFDDNPDQGTRRRLTVPIVWFYLLVLCEKGL